MTTHTSSSVDFFKIITFEKDVFVIPVESQFGSRPGLNFFFWPDVGPNCLLIKLISRGHLKAKH